MHNKISTVLIHEKLNFSELLESTIDIVVSYVSHNKVPIDQIPYVINTVYQSISKFENRPVYLQEPAVPVHKSICDDHIVCLEEGKKLQMLKRHLQSVHNMT